MRRNQWFENAIVLLPFLIWALVFTYAAWADEFVGQAVETEPGTYQVSVQATGGTTPTTCTLSIPKDSSNSDYQRLVTWASQGENRIVDYVSPCAAERRVKAHKQLVADVAQNWAHYQSILDLRSQNSTLFTTNTTAAAALDAEAAVLRTYVFKLIEELNK